MVTSDEKFSKNKFIGRSKEQERFKELLNKKEPRQALFIEADGGVGKTKLLEQFIEICIKENWSLGGETKVLSEIVIDFYTLENRTILGLRKNIIARLGERFFPKYLDKVETFNNFLSKIENRQDGKIAILLSEMRASFLKELDAINPQELGPTALFFDTFERGNDSYEIRKWFLEEFIPRANKLNIFVIFAGRKRSYSPSKEIYKYVLENFTFAEYLGYFEHYAGKLATGEKIIFELSKGKPLIVELMDAVGWDDYSQKILDIAEDDYEEFLGLLISRFVNNSYEDQFIKVIKEMAYLKRGYTKKIFEHRRNQNYPNIKDWDELKDNLLVKYPFIKYYPLSDSLVLHDEFQNMMEIHSRRNFILIASELREDIVEKLYENIIDETVEGDIKNLLRVEQLAYLLDIKGENSDKIANLDLAKDKLHKYNEARSHVLDSFIISEVSVLEAKKFPVEYQYEILTLLGKMARRVYRYEDSVSYWNAVVEYSSNRRNYKVEVESLLSLHNVELRSYPSQTFDTLEKALKICQEHNEAKELTPRVLNEIGFNYSKFQSYEKAIEYYDKAIKFIREGEFTTLKPKIINNLGDAYLETGDIDKAKKYIELSLSLKQENLKLLNKSQIEKIVKAEISIGASHVILGKAERYSNNLIESEVEYSRAISMFQKHNHQLSLASALLERGEMYRRIARKNFEKDLLDNISDYEEKARNDIQTGFELCQYNNSLNLLGRAHRRIGRLLHDQGYRSEELDQKLEYYKEALEEFEKARDIAVRVKDVREELENLREIAFFADDMADIAIQNQSDELKIDKDLRKLEEYIYQFEKGLKSHENNMYRLYNYDAFRALLTLEKAAFSYAIGQKDNALKLYTPAFVNLAKLPGYGVANYLAYLPHLFKNIQKLNDKDLERVWCGTIKTAWIKERLDKTRKEMMDYIEVHMLKIGED